MRRSSVLTTLAICASILAAAGISATAQTTRPSRPATVVAIVNLAKVMDGLDEAKDAKTRLEEQVNASKKKLEEINDRLKKIDGDMDLLKEKKESKEYRQMVYEKLELASTGKARSEILQQLIDEEEGTTVRGMYVRMADAINRLAAAEGIDLVLRDDRDIIPPERTNQGRPLTGREVRGIIDQRSMMAASERIDITSQVITMMNNEFKGGRAKLQNQ
jgi:Skp family chaperone for outer membrane proteins